MTAQTNKTVNLHKISNQTFTDMTLEQMRTSALSDTLREMLVNQLAHELKNYTLYNSFSVYFACKGLEKISAYFKTRANEELTHQQWVMEYLQECGTEFEYPAVGLNENQNFTDFVTPFELTLDREIETTQMINAIADEALKEHDWKTLSFLLGTFNAARLIPEQIEEEATSRTALDIMRTDECIMHKENRIAELLSSGK